MPVLVLHTTETDPGTAQAVADGLRARKAESHTVFDPSNGEHIRLLAWSQNAKALRNLSGGVETNNRGGVYQVEIVGRAAEVPMYSSGWFAALAVYVERVCSETGTPVVFPRPFVAYPQSYGLKAAQRMTNDEWLDCSGIVGHQHVPESDHGDPGDMTRLVQMLSLQPEDEDDMTPDEIRFGKLADGSTINDRLLWTNSQVDKVLQYVQLVAEQVAAMDLKVKNLTAPQPAAVDSDVVKGAVKEALREGTA